MQKSEGGCEGQCRMGDNADTTCRDPNRRDPPVPVAPGARHQAHAYESGWKLFASSSQGSPSCIIEFRKMMWCCIVVCPCRPNKCIWLKRSYYHVLWHAGTSRLRGSECWQRVQNNIALIWLAPCRNNPQINNLPTKQSHWFLHLSTRVRATNGKNNVHDTTQHHHQWMCVVSGVWCDPKT